jgi:NTP pyrophosphatase (non-canonical NTP hydrolase)
MTIGQLQEHVKELSDAQGWAPRSAETRMIYLVTEVGELAKEVLNLGGAQGQDEVVLAKERLGLEMYDVIWNLFDLANIVGLDVEAAFARKIEINRGRTWRSLVR